MTAVVKLVLGHRVHVEGAGRAADTTVGTGGDSETHKQAWIISMKFSCVQSRHFFLHCIHTLQGGFGIQTPD